ncbi:MAG: hypothetical protein AAB116_26590, partial [Candidatus Poribacteria bacterium]
PKRFTQRLKGEMELLFSAPPGRNIKWVSLGGYFGTYHLKDAVNTKNEIWYAPGDSDEWNLAYRASVPEWHSHWHYTYDKEIMLEKPVDKIRVKYVGQPGVNGVRVNIHSVKDDDKTNQRIVVTHGFIMDGVAQEKRFSFDSPTEYIVDCPTEPEDVFIKLEVPNG